MCARRIFVHAKSFVFLSSGPSSTVCVSCLTMLSTLATLLPLAGVVSAVGQNVVYWGQNGGGTIENNDLSTYCTSTSGIDILVLAFLCKSFSISRSVTSCLSTCFNLVETEATAINANLLCNRRIWHFHRRHPFRNHWSKLFHLELQRRGTKLRCSCSSNCHLPGCGCDHYPVDWRCLWRVLSGERCPGRGDRAVSLGVLWYEVLEFTQCGFHCDLYIVDLVPFVHRQFWEYYRPAAFWRCVCEWV